MEKNKMVKSDDMQIEDEIYKLCKPHFEKVLQEKLGDSMTTTKKAIKLSIRFNNYRRQQKIKLYKDSTIQKIQSAIPLSNYVNRTKLMFIHDYKPQVTIQLAKNTITGIWHQNIINGQKEVYVLEAQTLEDVDKWFNNKKEQIETAIDTALKDFMRAFGIRQAGMFRPEQKRKEIEVKGEEYIDSLPQELILHDTVGKKVYSMGFEFKDEIYAKNYIKTRAVEDVAPQIAEQLILIQAKIDLLDKRQEITATNQEFYNRNIVKHFEVLKGIEGAIDRLSDRLPNKRRQQKSWTPEYIG